MTDPTPAAAAAPAAAPAPDFNIPITLPGTGGNDPTDLTGAAKLPDVVVNIDASQVPADTRLELLKQKIRDTVLNRVSVAASRHTKALAPFVAYDEALVAYTAAMAADPLQSAVAKPEAPKGERPAAPDLVAKANEAIADLLAGKVRQKAEGGTGRKRGETKDPLVTAVTGVVTRAVFDANKAADATYSWPKAVKEVGGDGIAYLNAQIEAKLAATPEAERDAARKQLEASRDARYINPAKVMLGITALGGKQASLPSLL